MLLKRKRKAMSQQKLKSAGTVVLPSEEVTFRKVCKKKKKRERTVGSSDT